MAELIDPHEFERLAAAVRNATANEAKTNQDARRALGAHENARLESKAARDALHAYTGRCAGFLDPRLRDSSGRSA